MTLGFREEISQYYARLDRKTVALGIGCAWMGGAADAETLKQYLATLDLAYEKGFRIYDTSAAYGGSEFRVGTFLRNVARSSVFVATKSHIPAPLTPKEAALYIRQSLCNSLERLGLDSIDLFQIHDVTSLDAVMGAGGALEALLAAKEEGLIRYFGLATRWHDLLEIAALHGAFDTILTFFDHSLADQTAMPLVQTAYENGVGVLNASPLGFGLLTGEDPRHNPRISGEFRRYLHIAGKAYDFAKEKGFSLVGLALQYPLLNPAISVTLTGPVSPKELQEAIDGVQEAHSLALWREMQARLGTPLPAGLGE